VTLLGISSVSSGIATLTYSASLPVSHSITAVYSGDGTFFASTSPVLTQTVNPMQPLVYPQQQERTIRPFV